MGGETILGASYYRGELRDLPDSYLAPYREVIQAAEEAKNQASNDQIDSEPNSTAEASTVTTEQEKEELSAQDDMPEEPAQPKQDPVRPTSNRTENKYDL